MSSIYAGISEAESVAIPSNLASVAPQRNCRGYRNSGAQADQNRKLKAIGKLSLLCWFTHFDLTRLLCLRDKSSGDRALGNPHGVRTG